jgi:hypothetical protein
MYKKKRNVIIGLFAVLAFFLIVMSASMREADRELQINWVSVNKGENLQVELELNGDGEMMIKAFGFDPHRGEDKGVNFMIVPWNARAGYQWWQFSVPPLDDYWQARVPEDSVRELETGKTYYLRVDQFRHPVGIDQEVVIEFLLKSPSPTFFNLSNVANYIGATDLLFDATDEQTPAVPHQNDTELLEAANLPSDPAGDQTSAVLVEPDSALETVSILAENESELVSSSTSDVVEFNSVLIGLHSFDGWSNLDLWQYQNQFQLGMVATNFLPDTQLNVCVTIHAESCASSLYYVSLVTDSGGSVWSVLGDPNGLPGDLPLEFFVRAEQGNGQDHFATYKIERK